MKSSRTGISLNMGAHKLPSARSSWSSPSVRVSVPSSSHADPDSLLVAGGEHPAASVAMPGDNPFWGPDSCPDDAELVW